MEILRYSLIFAGGLAAGVLFFAGLKLTVRHALMMKRRALWFALSFVVRTAGLLAAGALISRGRWPDVIIMPAGFALARVIMVPLGRQKRPPVRRTADAFDS